MSFQKNGDRTLGRYILVPNPETETLFREAVRLYGDVLQNGERVNVAMYTRLLRANIPATDPKHDDYLRALACAGEIPAHQDIGAGPVTFGAVREFDRASGAELAPAPMPAHPSQA